MKILVVNDDGINARGLRKLALMASQLGEVTVVAPASQCSAMSQRLTVRKDMTIKKHDLEIEGVRAYSVSGTPADCVKVAVEYLMDEKPDVVFSGINWGYNVGYEVVYSGTVGAAMEACMKEIPAIAFSVHMNEVYDVVDDQLLTVTKEILAKSKNKSEIWNVNIPGCTLDEYKGVLWDRELAQTQFFLDQYTEVTDVSECRRENEVTGNMAVVDRLGEVVVKLEGYELDYVPEGSDLRAVLDGYISIGKIKNMAMK